MHNIDIREVARSSGVKLWEIGDVLGVCDSSFSRKLRKELSEEEKQNILEIIERIRKEKND